MKSILIKQVLCNGTLSDVLIEGEVFSMIDTHIETVAELIVDGKGKAVLPPFYNGHTHAAMTLLRGYADDLPLFTWLSKYIWPLEAKMTADDIYWGTKLAVLEMIKSGTVFFNDMYWHDDATILAVEEMGVKAAIGMPLIEATGKKNIDYCFERLDSLTRQGALPRNVQVTVAPHAIYTVGETLFKKCVEYAERKGLVLHTHLSETQQEVDDCIKKYGMRPVEWLDSLGALQPNLVAAHVIHVNDKEMDLLAENKVTLVHNPVSNMKLGSGVFPSAALLDAGCRIALGTDGCSSNNNLDMREEMKTAALLAKCHYRRPELLPAETLYRMCNLNCSEAFHLQSGTIEVGKKADALLIDITDERMVPCHNLISNWLYSAESSIIDTVICNGDILMQHRHVHDEEEILDHAAQCAYNLKNKLKP